MNDIEKSFADFFASWNWVHLGISVLIVLVAIALIITISKLYKKHRNHKMLNTSAANISISLAKAVIVFLAVVFILQINGINVTGLVTSMGVLSVIVTVGLQNVFADVFAGVRISSDHFYEIGDVIRTDCDEGIVIHFTLRTTTIRSTITDDIVCISNGEIKHIHRVSEMNDLDLPLPYSMSYAESEALIEKMVQRIRGLEDIKKCSYEGVSKFADSSIDHRIRFFCNPRARLPLKRKVQNIILQTLNEEHVSIPFNQLDVMIKNHED